MTDTPPEREVKEFQFKQLARFRVQKPPSNPKNGRLNHVAVSNRFGLIFVVTENGFKVFRSTEVISHGVQLGKAANQIVEDFQCWTEVDIQQCPQGVGISSDNLTLSVCIKKSGFPSALMYDVRAFTNKGNVPTPFLEVKLTSNTDCEVQVAAWNPGAEYPSMFAVCLSDGSMVLLSIKENLEIVASVPSSANITCICWSPKGKQLVAGKKDGSLTQYDQKFTEKRKISGAPNVFGDNCPQMVIDILWESTFVFFASYLPINNTSHEQPHLLHIVCPKTGQPTYCDLDDVCYGGGEDRIARVYFNMMAEWKVIVAASANSLEAAVLGKRPDNEALWEKWLLEDSGRAEMPMTEDYKETWPMGVAIDFTSQIQIPLGDNRFHPPSPVLMLFATDGVLVMFHMLNSVPGIPSLQKAVEVLKEEGIRKDKSISLSSTPRQTPAVVTSTPQPPSSASSNPTARILFQTPSSASQEPAVTSTAIPKQPSGLFASVVPQQQTQATIRPGMGGGQTAGSSAGFMFGNQNAAAVVQTPGLGSLSKPVAQSTPAPTIQNSSVQNPTQKVPQELAANKPPSGFSFGVTVAKSDQGAETSSTQVSAPSPNITPQQQPAQQQPKQPMTSLQPPQPSRTVSMGKRASDAVTTQQQQQQVQPEVTPQQSVQNNGRVRQQPAPVPGNSRPLAHARRKSHENDDPFMKAIMEEMEHFQKELNDLKSRSSAAYEPIGNRAEMVEMVKNSREMFGFYKDIKEQTHGINGEIHSLKSQCLESFATIEECRAREERNRDPSYRHLLGSRSLDPMSERKLKEIRTQFHYVDNGIRDVDLKLDMEWEEYQRKKKQGSAMKTPASDAIYRTITNNKRVIDNHLHSLDKLCGELNDLKLYNSTGWEARRKATISNSSVLTNVSGGGNLGQSMTDSRKNSIGSRSFGGTGDDTYQPRTLSGSVKRASVLQNKSLNSMSENLFNSSLSPQKAAGSPISPEKQAKLRDLLGNRRVTPVKSTAPANLSKSRFVSSERLQETPEATFANNTLGSQELEESYLHTRSTALHQSKPEPQIKANTVLANPRQQQSASPFESSSVISGGVTASAKPTAFAAINKNSPQLSPVTEKINGMVMDNKTKGNNERVTTSVNKKGPGSGLVIGSGLAGARQSQGFSFGASPVSTQGQNFNFTGSASSQAPAASPMPKAMTSALATSLAGGTTAQKPVAITAGIASSKSAPQFDFGSTFNTEPSQSSNKPFVFTPTSNVQSTGSQSSTLSQNKAGGQAPQSAGFSFNTDPSKGGSFAFGTAAKSDSNQSSGSLQSKGFAFGSSATSSDEKSKTPFSPFSGAGNQLGGKTTATRPVMGDNTNNTVEPQQQTTNIKIGKTPSITKDLIKGLTNPETQGFDKEGVTEGGDGRGTETGLSSFGLPGDGSASLSTGDFQFGGALASILVNEPTTVSSVSSPADNLASDAEVSGGISINLKQPPEIAPTAANGQSGFAFGGSNSGFAFGGSPNSNKSTTQNTTTPTAGFLFGKPTSSSGSDVGSGTIDSSSLTNKSTNEVAPTIVQQPSDAPPSPTPISVQQQPTDEAPGTHLTGETDVSEVVNASVKEKNGLKSIQDSNSAPNDTVPKRFAFNSNDNAGSVFGGGAQSANASGFAFRSTVTDSGEKPGAGAPTSDTTVITSTSEVKSITGNTTNTRPTESNNTKETSQPAANGNTPVPEVKPTATVAATGFSFTTTSASSTLEAATTPAVPIVQPLQTNTTTVNATTAPTSATGGLFGAPASTTNSTGFFGSQTTSGLFGGLAASTTQTAVSGFGATVSTSATNAPLFSQMGGASTQSTGLFGQSTASTGGMFGNPSSTAPTSTSGEGIFGATQTGGISSSSGTGFGSSGFGFGQQTSSSVSSSGFGSTPSFGQASAFGSGSTTGQSASGGMFESSSGGGNLFGLGGKPSAENANKNVFGSGFGGGAQAQQTQQNLFGNPSNSAFNSATGASGNTGAGPFSSGGGSTFSGGGVSSTGFGGFGAGQQQTPQKPSGFGAAPAFGGSPAFGSPPSFGSQATFGTSTFGAGAGSGGGAVFGSASNQASSGFASFASSDAPSFGNLAQNTGGGGGGFGNVTGGFGANQQQQQPIFGGGGGTGGGGFGGFGGFGQQSQPSNGFGQQPTQQQQPTSPSFSSYRG